MELLKQLQKNSFFLFFLIFFFASDNSLAKIFSNNLELNGSFTQGGLLFGKTNSKNKVIFKDKNIFVNDNGDFILAIGRDNELENSIIIQGIEKKEIHKIKISKRKYKIQRIDGLPKNKVTPNEQEMKRIKKESKKIKNSKNMFLNETLYKSGFIWPVKGIITGKYGNQRILNGKPRRPHYGLDIAAKSGTKIVSPSDAKVTLIMEDSFFNGKMIILNHGLGMNSIYSHLKKINVKEGDKIKKGDLIAEVGSTGRSTGPHLDWRINIYSVAIDPELLLLNQPDF
ncbi:MAG: peptidase [Pelagibacteraceae bacterium]|nr:peptidase [Pelagibacteraceae bacterium]|tara:strand:- start:4520 stop:5371 length:852 start_codon:yes stop_codon:yes gene_type:complete